MINIYAPEIVKEEFKKVANQYGIKEIKIPNQAIDFVLSKN